MAQLQPAQNGRRHIALGLNHSPLLAPLEIAAEAVVTAPVEVLIGIVVIRIQRPNLLGHIPDLVESTAGRRKRICEKR
jgi:hypothetical protein